MAVYKVPVEHTDGLLASQVVMTNVDKLLVTADYLDQSVKQDSTPVFENTNTALSPMILTGGEISEGTNAGTIKIAALTAMLRTTNSVTGILTKVTLAEQDNVVLAAADTWYYVILNYGAPCTISISATAPNSTTNICIGHCLKEVNNTVHKSTGGYRLGDGVAKLHRRAKGLRGMELAGGGQVASIGIRNFTITAATVWRGVNEYAFTGKDTSVSDTFDYYYWNPDGAVWVKDDNGGFHYTQIDNLQYNKVDSGTGLDNLGVAKYTTNWVFIHPDNEYILVVYGRSYTLQTAAENEDVPPSLPDILDEMSILLAKVIIRQGSDALIIQNRMTACEFLPSVVVDHNDLSGLQGGAVDEYYHLTSAEYSGLDISNWDAAHSHVSADGSSHSFIDQAVTISASPTFGGIVIANNGTIGQAAGPLLNFDDTNNYLEITGCNVGIGTTTPGAKLHVNQTAIDWALDVTGVLDFPYSRFWDGTNGVYIIGGATPGIQSSSGEPLILYSNNVEQGIYISATAGNVGIGTNSPYTRLTIEGTLTLKEQAAADADTAAYGQIWVKNTTPNELWFTDDAGTDLRIAPQDLQTTASPTFAVLLLTTIKSGATQAAAGAAANELWKTNGHATLPDNIVMIGV